MGARFDDGDPEVLRLMRIDEMTGLCNRAYLLHRIHDDMLRNRRYGWPLCVLALAIDRFEEVEVGRGPIVRDTTLATVASIVRKFARDTDIPSRLTASRFGVLLPGTALEGARVIADRLRDRVATHLFVDERQATVPITCSIGFAEVSDAFSDAEAFLGCACDAMSLAQSEGGDRCRVGAAGKHEAGREVELPDEAEH